MRFPLAWAETANQNTVLKFSLLFSSIVTCVLVFTVILLSLKKPLVIDRGCFSTASNLGSYERSESEIDSFIKLALERRFSTEQFSSNNFWLSELEEAERKSEIRELSQKNISQRILVSKIDKKDNTAIVEIDRILSVDKLKSVFPVVIQMRLGTTQRNAENVYGLILEKTELKSEGK
jgi:hypothetical protein